MFRKLFLEEQSIGIIPQQGYRPKDKQSVKAMQCIRYHAQQTNIEIQHADNEGEKVIGPYKSRWVLRDWESKGSHGIPRRLLAWQPQMLFCQNTQ